jgi:hypothetical protein
LLVSGVLAVPVRPARADVPATPTGAHSRLFLSAKTLAAVTANAQKAGTAAANFAAGCQDTIDNAENYATRGGADGNTWPHAALVCAFGYTLTKKPEYLTQALK